MGADNLTLIVVLILILCATYYVFSGKFAEGTSSGKSSTAEHLENVQPDGSADSAGSASSTASVDDQQQSSVSDGSENSVNIIAQRAKGPNNVVPSQTGQVSSNVPEINGSNDELSGANLDTAYGTPLDNNDTKDPLNSSKLLPTKDKSKNWFDDVEAVDVKNSHLINIYRPIGVNSIGQGARNRTYDIRGTGDAVCPQFTVSPWLQSSIQPDRSMKSLC